ncbi:hypothetical protein D041_4079A, partial [Vibrio parahaemolyticus EKP-008]
MFSKETVNWSSG